MSDYDSSLPIRTEAAGDVDIFISDSVTPSQKLAVEADGSINVNASATDLDIRDLVFATDKVDVSGSSVTVSATDLDIRDLAFATDSVTAHQGGTWVLDSITNDVNVTATDLDIRDLAFASDSVTAHQGGTWTIDSITNDVNVTATDLDIRDLDAAQDSIQANLFDEAGVAYSLTNPMPVEMVSDQAGDEILDYQTSAAVAKNASVNHDYTVTAGKTFLGEEAWISGSGKLKVDLLVNGSVVFTGFNSTANPNVRIPLEKILKANAAEVVRFTITNRDNQPQDLYSTLTGLEV